MCGSPSTNYSKLSNLDQTVVGLPDILSINSVEIKRTQTSYGKELIDGKEKTRRTECQEYRPERLS